MNATRKKIRLGDLLVENGLISQAQLEAALAEQKRSGRKLGRVFVDNGFIAEASLLEFLSRQLGIPHVDLRHVKADADTLRLLPEIHARRYRALVVDEVKGKLVVGMADPTDIFAYDELHRILKRAFDIAVVSEAQLLQAFDTVYRRTEEINSFAEELNDELSERDVELGLLGESGEVTDAPVVKLVQSLFEDAVQVGASDLHIEPDEDVLRIRQRVDGVLQEQLMDEKRIASAVVLRLKLVAGLDIAEKRLPQDGRFTLTIKGVTIDVRISTMPTQHGESVVMRLLNQSSGVYGLDQIGMEPVLRRRFQRCISRPNGMVLVTGPTGSGKTTTLYGALKHLNRAETKIITVEDPVEYRLSRINQVQVRPDIGLTFARVLRTVLRQDPDVVLVGEMRDEETAEIGLRAAMTGHLVLSTLHTNDAVSTVNRLVDMNAEGYLIASALHAVIAQRLVRRVCDSCERPYEPGEHARRWIEQRVGRELDLSTLRRGAGCSHCNETGYHGRVGVYELLEIDDPMRDALTSNDLQGFARAANRALGDHTLVHAAVDTALRGVTTFDDVIRIAGGVDGVDGIEPEPEPARMSDLPALAG